MNWDMIESNWRQFMGKCREHWGRLTDDDLEVIAGKRERLCGRIQELYGVGREEAELQIQTFVAHQRPPRSRGEPA